MGVTAALAGCSSIRRRDVRFSATSRFSAYAYSSPVTTIDLFEAGPPFYATVLPSESALERELDADAFSEGHEHWFDEADFDEEFVTLFASRRFLVEPGRNSGDLVTTRFTEPEAVFRVTVDSWPKSTVLDDPPRVFVETRRHSRNGDDPPRSVSVRYSMPTQ
ncbi:hypothetical protein ACFO5R_04245 [Halosolutus amylolyticus]|uniref:Uncharacterized protein n=1 Tax=Halosolutus amylolyticus TaxID=2932267 RepID=A0ABD5PKM8_9EURY|nr:hypothetical protein [Halosolutus amylolyticus]